MATVFWSPAAALNAHTAYALPSAANATRIIAVRNVLIIPASGTAGVPIVETGIASVASGASGAGQIAVNIANQEFTSGDTIPAGAAVIMNVVVDGAQPVNP